VGVGLGAGLALASALVVLARGAPGVRRPALALCVAALAVQLLLVGLRGVAEARYLTPAAGALGVLLAAGIGAPLAPERRPLGARVLVVLVLSWAALYLWRGLVVHQELAWSA
jgi:hypothetical protein